MMYIVQQTEEFHGWLDGLRDFRAQARITTRLRQAEAGNLGDWKPIEGALAEMRVDVGAGYRLYFTRRGNVVVVMLAGGDKSSQKRDLRKAKQMLKQMDDL